MKCNLCLSENIHELGAVGFSGRSVTSDSNTCPVPARIYKCGECHHLQKHYTEEDMNVINSVYRSYDPHNLSGGSEQLVFPKDLPPRPRTYHAIEKCAPFLNNTGRLLDVGSGNGAVLKSASKILSNWDLTAFDIVDHYKEDIMNIHNVTGFYSGTIADLPGKQYDLIVLWHVLEHLEDPRQFFEDIKGKLSAKGHVLVQVPDIQRNPFDFAVIDHCSHFTKKRLSEFFENIGFQVFIDGHEWFHNCITLLLRYGPYEGRGPSHSEDNTEPESFFLWLNTVPGHIEKQLKTGDFAIFGTGMASIWLSEQLKRRPQFFIDEDTAKSGSQINNVPILMPDNVETGIVIVMPFLNNTGEMIAEKLRRQYRTLESCEFILCGPYR